MRSLPPGVPVPVAVLRALLIALPCAALALALPEVPHWAVITGVVVGGAVWARTPDHAVGVVPLALVAGWWSSHGVVDWRVLVVGVLLLAAHLAATLASYGPATLALDGRLVRLWVGRGLLALVPLPVAWFAVRGLDTSFAPPGLWLATGVVIVALLLVTTRLTRSVPR